MMPYLLFKWCNLLMQHFCRKCIVLDYTRYVAILLAKNGRVHLGKKVHLRLEHLELEDNMGKQETLANKLPTSLWIAFQLWI